MTAMVHGMPGWSFPSAFFCSLFASFSSELLFSVATPRVGGQPDIARTWTAWVDA